MKIFFKESFPCCNSLIHQDKNSYGLPKWTIKTRTYDNCQKSWTILQFVKFQEKTVRSCRLYYSPASQWWMYLKNISEKNINILRNVRPWKETATISYLRMFMGRMQMKWEMRIRRRNFWVLFSLLMSILLRGRETFFLPTLPATSSSSSVAVLRLSV